jgi:HEPN domain-containing protein
MKTYHDIALSDLHTAGQMMDVAKYNYAVRLFEQYVEKVMKHRIFLYGDDNDRSLLYSHRVPKLGKRCEVLLGITFTDKEMLLFNDLANFYFDTNYPGDDYVEIAKEEAESIWAQVLAFQEKYEQALVSGAGVEQR